jgi:hypothetical protein
VVRVCGDGPDERRFPFRECWSVGKVNVVADVAGKEMGAERQIGCSFEKGALCLSVG